MNLLAVGAAYGIVTAVFQEGHGATAIGLDGAIPIVSYVPMMMFAILFGLAMDYQVFLLSRVREEIDAGKSPRQAVVDGLAGTGKVIASAAAIMVAVFASFILNGDPTVKEFGVGLASAILIAGSMVCVLLPAVMLLMGRRTWWLPRRLDRVLPAHQRRGPEARPPTPRPRRTAPDRPRSQPHPTHQGGPHVRCPHHAPRPLPRPAARAARCWIAGGPRSPPRRRRDRRLARVGGRQGPRRRREVGAAVGQLYAADTDAEVDAALTELDAPSPTPASTPASRRRPGRRPGGRARRAPPTASSAPHDRRRRSRPTSTRSSSTSPSTTSPATPRTSGPQGPEVQEAFWEGYEDGLAG